MHCEGRRKVKTAAKDEAGKATLAYGGLSSTSMLDLWGRQMEEKHDWRACLSSPRALLHASSMSPRLFAAFSISSVPSFALFTTVRELPPSQIFVWARVVLFYLARPTNRDHFVRRASSLLHCLSECFRHLVQVTRRAIMPRRLRRVHLAPYIVGICVFTAISLMLWAFNGIQEVDQEEMEECRKLRK